MIYFRLGQAELAKALDEKGRNKAVAANLLPLIVLIGTIAYGIITNSWGAAFVLLGIVVNIGAVLLGAVIQSAAVIESVYRCKDGKNKRIYLKNKAYFDKKFARMNRPCRKLSINEQQGGDRLDRRKQR